MRMARYVPKRKSSYKPPTFLVLLLVSLQLCCFTGLALHAKGTNTQLRAKHNKYDYDLVIIGAGASGLFASGAARSFGLKTLLLDQGDGFVGGDCSNAACVPSKALRSIARKMATRSAVYDEYEESKHKNRMVPARDHIFNTVLAVRKREDIRMFANVTNFDFLSVESCQFRSKDEVEIIPRNNRLGVRTIKANKYLIATGASPVIPPFLQKDAARAGLRLYTYRDILSPDRCNNSAWKQFCQEARSAPLTQNILIAGGGPTAVELSQSLARLQMNVTIAAPTLLAEEDVSLQQAACQILRNDHVNLVLGRRVVGVSAEQQVILDDGTQIATDAMIVCVGRKPSVESLNLEAAGIGWDPSSGVIVHSSSLRSRSNPRVFACGDCCSAIQGRDRKAAHGAWTGYHAVRNLALPWFLWAGSPAVHPTVPSVIYTDPELASVGLTRSECIKQYGQKGYLYESIREEGSDRADMERMERFVGAGFVELRAEQRSGRILGLTASGPAASELANEIGLAIQNKLTVRDLARSIHSYPSHGYLLYRLSLKMALSSTKGFLDTLGPVGRLAGTVYGAASNLLSKIHPHRLLPWKRNWQRKQRLWQAHGEQQSMIVSDPDSTVSDLMLLDRQQAHPISLLDLYSSGKYLTMDAFNLSESFHSWMESRPM